MSPAPALRDVALWRNDSETVLFYVLGPEVLHVCFKSHASRTYWCDRQVEFLYSSATADREQMDNEEKKNIDIDIELDVGIDVETETDVEVQVEHAVEGES